MTTSVAIIGGGAVGLSTAWHLVERGVTDVTVLEVAELAAGSSSRSAGFIETQYVDPLDIELRALSMHTFRRPQRDHGLEIKEIGYLRLAPDDETLEAFGASARLQRELGIDDTEVLDPDGVRRLIPWLRAEGAAGGLFGPRDANPIRHFGAASVWVVGALILFMYLVFAFITAADPENPEALPFNVLIASDHAVSGGRSEASGGRLPARTWGGAIAHRRPPRGHRHRPTDGAHSADRGN